MERNDMDQQIAECLEKFPSLYEEILGQPKTKTRRAKPKKSAAQKPTTKKAEKKKPVLKKRTVSARKPAAKSKKVVIRKTPRALAKPKAKSNSPRGQSESLQSCDPMNVPRYFIVRRAMGCMVKNVIKKYAMSGKTAVSESQIVKEVLNCLRNEAESEAKFRNRIKFTINAGVKGKTLTKHPDGRISLGPHVKRACPRKKEVKVEKVVQVNNSSRAVQSKQTRKPRKKQTAIERQIRKKSTKSEKKMSAKSSPAKKAHAKTGSKKKSININEKEELGKTGRKRRNVAVNDPAQKKSKSSKLKSAKSVDRNEVDNTKEKSEKSTAIENKINNKNEPEDPIESAIEHEVGDVDLPLERFGDAGHDSKTETKQKNQVKKTKKRSGTKTKRNSGAKISQKSIKVESTEIYNDKQQVNHEDAGLLPSNQ